MLQILVFNLFLSSLGMSAEIKFIPFRIQTYRRVTPENMDQFCVMKGVYNLKSLKNLNSKNCSSKPDYKINVRASIKINSDRTVLIDQQRKVWLNDFECKLTDHEASLIIQEVENLMAGKDRICQDGKKLEM